MKRNAIRVSEGEMELLSMLWSSGPLTLRQAHETFGKLGRRIGYSTMQTRLNRLVDKRLVEKTNEHPASYRAIATRNQVTLGHLRQIIDKLCSGDVVPLVARLLDEQVLTADQIAELEQLLSEAQHKSAKSKRGGRHESYG